MFLLTLSSAIYQVVDISNNGAGFVFDINVIFSGFLGHLNVYNGILLSNLLLTTSCYCFVLFDKCNRIITDKLCPLTGLLN